jgi:thiamine pyrophosphokinase
MKALLIANGPIEQPEVLKKRIAAGGFDLVVGVDGGAAKALALGIRVNAVIGDMDSLSEATRQACEGAEFITHPREKDETDLELAMAYVMQKGAGEIVMACAAGGRLDSAIDNVLLMARNRETPCKIALWHGGQTAWIIQPPGEEITGEQGDTLSLIPMSGDASGVTTAGLKYPLRGETLLFSAGRGMSNVFLGDACRVSVSEGKLLAVHTPLLKEGAKTLNVSVQVLPLSDAPIPIIDKAIEAIQSSGVKYEVGPLETTLEGDNLDDLLEVAKAAHRACFGAGADKVVSIIKIAESTAGTSIEEKVSKYRKRSA